MLDRVCTRIDRRLYAVGVDCVGGKLEVGTMRLLYRRSKFRNCEVLIGCNLDNVDVVNHILSDCLPRLVGSVDEQKFLIQNRVGNGRIETPNVPTARNEFASGSKDSRAGDAACVDGVAQFGIAINARMAKVTNRRDAALQNFPNQ